MTRILRSTSTALALGLLLAGAARAQPLRDRTGPAGVLDLFRAMKPGPGMNIPGRRKKPTRRA